jgi:uracil-DNA glycosylase family 4
MDKEKTFNPSEEIKAIAREMHARMVWYREMGIDSWGKLQEAGAAHSTIENRPPHPAETLSLFGGDANEEGSLFLESPSKAPSMTLEEIRVEMGDCQRCKLCSTRTHIVFGSGNPNAPLLFIGEAPGEDEDLQGKPFVGKAGQLLTKMISAMGLSREEVYIANIIKCRPPKNRNPQPDEIASCRPFLLKQIEAIRPKMICALGTFSAQTLLSSKQRISELRGRFHEWNGIKLLATFHPAYLLRNPHEKRRVWEDLQKIMAELRKR